MCSVPVGNGGAPGVERGCSPCQVLLDLQAEASGALERNTGISRALSGPIPPFHFFSSLFGGSHKADLYPACTALQVAAGWDVSVN